MNKHTMRFTEQIFSCHSKDKRDNFQIKITKSFSKQGLSLFKHKHQTDRQNNVNTIDELDAHMS